MKFLIFLLIAAVAFAVLYMAIGTWRVYQRALKGKTKLELEAEQEKIRQQQEEWLDQQLRKDL